MSGRVKLQIKEMVVVGCQDEMAVLVNQRMQTERGSPSELAGPCLREIFINFSMRRWICLNSSLLIASPSTDSFKSTHTHR